MHDDKMEVTRWIGVGPDVGRCRRAGMRRYKPNGRRSAGKDGSLARGVFDRMWCEKIVKRVVGMGDSISRPSRLHHAQHFRQRNQFLTLPTSFLREELVGPL